MAGPLILVREIRQLREGLYQVLQEQEGAAQAELVEHVLELAKARRQGDERAIRELDTLVKGLDGREAGVVLRAISILFDLINMAEDRHRVRVLRDRERRTGTAPRPESIGATLDQLSGEGYAAQQIQGFLNRLDIEPVFTAHPTEAKRRTVRTVLKSIQQCLARRDALDLLPREEREISDAIHRQLVALWQTDPHRPERPTVMEEVKRSLYAMGTLWEVVPRLYRDLGEGLARYFPGHGFAVPRFLHFGTWIGGDRDGHPHVTVEVTAATLATLRQAALDAHLEECRRVYGLLSMSDKRVKVSEGLAAALAAALTEWPQLASQLERISPHEVYRRFLRVVEWRLQQSMSSAPFAELAQGAYGRAAALEQDVVLLQRSLEENGGGAVVGEVADWLCRVRVFGLHMARLDVRQESGHYGQVVAELLARVGLCADYLGLDEAGKQEVLQRSLGHYESLDNLSDQARETTALFRLLTRAVQLYGADLLGGHIISMTHQPSDVLVVLWLLRWAAREVGGAEVLGVGTVGIVPLFETIDDLQRAEEIFGAILDCAEYEPLLAAQGRVQTAMVGYSDSTKDGGYLAASWALYRAQVQLHEAAARRGVQAVFFHGRGGALGRGGGPAARSILSLPPHTVGGAIRTTEQGEVLAARYDDRDIAFRHLEQITSATFLVEAEKGQAPEDEWLEIMDFLAAEAYRAYRELVAADGFVEYFRQATPIAAIEDLPIGSRPARRNQAASLANLRAIPWVFAWTQSRAMIPAWYGMGTALEAFARTSAGDWEQLGRMYRKWMFFQGAVANAELALAKADMGIAHAYAQLMIDAGQREAIWNMLDGEYRRSCAAVSRMTGCDGLLDSVPWLQRSIRERDPNVDPLNLIQVELLRKLATTEDDAGLRDLLRQSIQGVSAGMRTTG